MFRFPALVAQGQMLRFPALVIVLVIEPVTEVSNHHVIESVEMVKFEGLPRVWDMKAESRELVETKFSEKNG